MRAYVTTHIQARGIHRVVDALVEHAETHDVEVVTSKADADLVVHHVVGEDNFDERPIWERVAEDVDAGRRYAIVQYCHRSAPSDRWEALWADAALVWSYLHLPPGIPRLYRSPLGVSEAFMHPIRARTRDIGVVTSGFVAGPGAEAIEEVAQAAARCGLSVLHIGPYPKRMAAPPPGRFTALFGLSDTELRSVYQRAKFVSGLRYTEGFELPAAEGACCGARPLMFNRLDAVTWHADRAAYVPEVPQDALVARIHAVLTDERPMRASEIAASREAFNWQRIVGGFWSRVIANVRMQEEIGQ